MEFAMNSECSWQEANSHFLRFIEISVPIWLAQLSSVSRAELLHRAHVAGELIAFGGIEVVMQPDWRKGKRPRCSRNLIAMRLRGEITMDMFNVIVEGIAAGLIVTGQPFEEWQRALGLLHRKTNAPAERRDAQ
jgi:hypothetical protein